MEKLKIGVIGLGGRGTGLVKGPLAFSGKAEIVAVCDTYPDRTEAAAEIIRKSCGKAPEMVRDYTDMLKPGKVDAVIVSASWENHIPIAVNVLDAGIACGLEVGGAYDLEDCRALVRAWERVRTPFMFLENCCYGKDELLALSLVDSGKLGKAVHCSGMYGHDLREEIAYGNINRHYRLRNYLMRNCDNYPTHELGPIAKILKINSGNRMLSLVSVASCSAGLPSYIKTKTDLSSLCGASFAQGDIVNTIIKCAGGETILLTLDTTLPRLYDRALTVRGTLGHYSQTLNAVMLDDGEFDHEKDSQRLLLDTAARYEKEFLPPEWLSITEDQIEAGHGGMDFIMMNAFFDALLNGKPMPIDVYDAAAWMSISCLSEESIIRGGAPVAIPDFTGGKWLLKEQTPMLGRPAK